MLYGAEGKRSRIDAPFGFKSPATTTRSLVPPPTTPGCTRSNTFVAPDAPDNPFRKVSVPGAPSAPGLTKLPAADETSPVTDPLPDSVWPALSV